MIPQGKTFLPCLSPCIFVRVAGWWLPALNVCPCLFFLLLYELPVLLDIHHLQLVHV